MKRDSEKEREGGRGGEREIGREREGGREGEREGEREQINVCAALQ